MAGPFDAGVLQALGREDSHKVMLSEEFKKYLDLVLFASICFVERSSISTLIRPFFFAML